MQSHWGEEPDWFTSDSEEDSTSDPNNNNNNDDDDDDDDFNEHRLGAFHCLLLIDCQCPGIFDLCPALHDIHYPEDPTTPMDFVVQAAEGMVRSKIKSSMIHKTGKRDAFGILLYNTRCRRPISNHENDVGHDKNDDEEEDDGDGHLLAGSYGTRMSTVHELVPLEPPGISTVKLLRSLQDDPIVGRQKSLEELYGSTHDDDDEKDDNEDCDQKYSESTLQTAISRAKEVLDSSKYVKKTTKTISIPDTKQIWIFTTDDDPCKGNERVKDVLQTFIAGVQEDGIQVCIWPLPYGNINGRPQKNVSDFDYEKFYASVGVITPLEGRRKVNNDLATSEQELDLTAIIEDMQFRWKKTTKSFAVPFLLPNWETNRDYPGIWLDVYRLLQVGRKPSRLPVHQETGRLLTKVEIVSNSTGQILSKKIGGKIVEKAAALTDRVISFVEFGGERVRMSEEDKVMLKKASNANSEFASLILLGFKTETSIRMTDILGQAYFAYPNEEHTKGSRDAFAHLHASMIRKGVIAIGEMLARKTSTSRQVAIWALEENVDEETGILVHPSGMMILELPFEEEVREVGSDASLQESLVHGKSLVSPDVVDVFATIVEKQSFDTVHIGENFENADLSIFWDYVEHVALGLPIPAKRDDYDIIPDNVAISKLVGDEVEKLVGLLPDDVEPKRETKKRTIVPDDSDIDWETVYLHGDLSKCRNEDLKKKLKSIGEKTGGNKADLVARLLPFLEEEFHGAARTRTENDA